MTIAEASGPFDTGTFLEDGWAKLFSMISHDGVRTTADLSGSISGATVILTQGRASVQGFLYEMTGSVAETATITPAVNGSGNPRIDLIVLRLNRSTNVIQRAVLAGTPAASPTAPALTQVEGGIWELPIWQYQFSSAGAISALTDLRYIQQAAWTAWTPTATAGLTVGNGTWTGSWKMDEQRLVTARFAFTLGSTSAVTGAVVLAFPTPISTNYVATENCGHASITDVSAGSAGRFATTCHVVTTATGGTFTFGGSASGSQLTTTVPMTWAVGDVLSGTVQFEANTN